jgi:hypothetical protein
MPLNAKRRILPMLANVKSVSTSASGQRTNMPTQLTAKLMLKVLDCLEYFLTRTTENADVTAEIIAKTTPITHLHVDEGIIKIISLFDFAGFFNCCK